MAGTEVGKWIAEPYIERVTDAGKDFYDTLTGDGGPPPAGATFNAVVQGRAAA